MKKIVYTATDSGIDGREPTTCVYASFDEGKRDAMIEADPNKNWRGKQDVIVDVDVAIRQALAKLDGVDLLVLGLTGETDQVSVTITQGTRGVK